MGVRVIMKICLFKDAYGTWHRRMELQRLWFDIHDIHLQTVQDQSLTSEMTGIYGYGGHATQQATVEEDAQVAGCLLY